MTDDRRFVVTFFADEYAQDLTEKEMSFDELRALVLNTTARQKSVLPWLKLANFGIKRTAENSLRHNANVETITGIEGDYDDKEMAFDRAVELLSQARLNALIYTSPSHVASAPKWRVILPTSQDLPPSERKKIVARVNGVLGGVLADEFFVLSQAYYLGSVNGNPDHRAVITEGDFIDLREDLDATARGKRSASDGAEQPRREGPRTDKQASNPDEVFAAMAVLPNEVDWIEWNSMGMACWLATNGHERGLEGFLMWSSKSSKHDEANTRERWQRYFASPPTEIGAGTIFQKADQAQRGWRALVGLPIDKVNEILKLSRLSIVAYDGERKETANELGIRVSTLDDIVDQLRPRNTIEDDDANKQGGRIEFAGFDPWPDAVDGKVLVADMSAAIRSYVILSVNQALGVALWVIHTHVFDLAEHAPRLQIKSPVMRCGKTRLLEVIKQMVAKALVTGNISTAALFRLIEAFHPTLLIDEADSFFKSDDGKDNEDMRGILNDGHGRGGSVIRTVGEDFEPREFKVFGPVAYAWLVKRGMHVAQTLEDRSITIELRRRLPDETITRFRASRTGHLRNLGRRVAQWAMDHRSSLVDADPSLPEQLSDRAQDNWRPLIAIADAMSADLGQAARVAAINIDEENTGGEDDAGTLALADVAATFKVKMRGRLPSNPLRGVKSKDLVEEMVAMTERPWSEWRRGKPLTVNGLNRLLKPFGLEPKLIKIGPTDADVLRGYRTEKVLEAEARFVDVETEDEVADEGF